MKMAKASAMDINAAGDMMALLIAIDRGDYPAAPGEENPPDWFDEEDPDHLRRFYDAVKSTLDAGPGWPGRVIGGMCYVILNSENELLDPDSDTLDLHPKFAAQEQRLAAACELLKQTKEFDTTHSIVGQRIRKFLEAV